MKKMVIEITDQQYAELNKYIEKDINLILIMKPFLVIA
jgi:hypothetical protein